MTEKNYIELGLDTIIQTELFGEKQITFFQDTSMREMLEEYLETYTILYAEALGDCDVLEDDCGREDEESVDIMKYFDFVVDNAAEYVEIKKNKEEPCLHILLHIARLKQILQKAGEILIEKIKDLY